MEAPEEIMPGPETRTEGVLAGAAGVERQLEESSSSSSSSETEATPLLDTFYADGLMEKNVFTLAFCSNPAVLAMGGIDDDAVVGDDSTDDESAITYVDTQKTYGEFYGYYLVELLGVKVDGEAITGLSTSSLNEVGGVLVDSGTTLLYLPSSAASAIETKVAAASTSATNRFFNMESCVSDLSDFPTLTLELDGYDLEVKPTEYTLLYDGCYYWGVESSDVGIIGNIALQNRLVVFDREDNRIGFARTDCGPGEYREESTGLPDTTSSEEGGVSDRAAGDSTDDMGGHTDDVGGYDPTSVDSTNLAAAGDSTDDMGGHTDDVGSYDYSYSYDPTSVDSTNLAAADINAESSRVSRGVLALASAASRALRSASLALASLCAAFRASNLATPSAWSGEFLWRA